ncbi:MAG: hypothetical protein GDA49_08620 [Rhodospirillales bacterium]|nr:hypothetical protein [Rhodospirillales bacterium]
MLERLAYLPDDANSAFCLLTHEELRHTVRVHAFMDFVAPHLAARGDLFDPR